MASILKVNELQNTGGTTALTINSDGSMTRAKAPSFMHRGSVTTVTSNTSGYNFLIFGASGSTDSFDIGSNYDNATSTFTAPHAGVYWFGTYLQFGSSITNAHIGIGVNGDERTGGGGGLTSNMGWRIITAEGMNPFWLLNLSANDTVRLVAHSAAITNFTGTDRASFMGYQVS